MAQPVPVEYQEKQDGTTEFVLADGGTATVWGEAAQALKQRVDQRRQEAPPAPPGMAQEGVERGMAQQEAAAGAAAEQFARLPPHAQRAHQRIAAGKTVVTPGRPEFDPAKHGATDVIPKVGGYLPHTKGVTTEMGPPVDEDYLGEQRGLAQQRTELAREQRDRDLELTRRETEHLKAQRIDLKRQQQDAAAELQQREATWKQDEAELDQLLEEQKRREIDPQRLFSGPGGFLLGIGSVVAQAMGAYGATLGGTPNFAQDIIDRAVGRDIAAQERELDELGRSANNALSRLERHYGDRQEAKAALEILQRQAIDVDRSELVAATNRSDILAAWKKAQLGEQQRLSDLRHQMQVAAHGKRVTKEGRAWAPYQEPRAGGVSRRPYTVEEAQAIELGEYTHEQKMGRARSPAQREKLELAEAKAGERMTTEKRKLVREYGKVRAGNTAAIESLTELRKRFDEQRLKYGGTKVEDKTDPRGYRVEGGDIPGLQMQSEIKSVGRLRKVGGVVGWEQAEDAQTNRAMFTAALNMAVEGNKGPASDRDVERYAAQLRGEDRTQAQTVHGVDAMLRKYTAKADADDATYVDVVPTWKAQQRIAQQRGRKEAGDQPQPR